MTSPIDMVGALGHLVNPAVTAQTVRGDGTEKTKLGQASRDLEALFVYQMLQQMRATVPESGLLSGGRAEKLYRQMLDSELAKAMAEQRGMGLGGMMEDNLSRAVEKNPGAVDAHRPDRPAETKTVATAGDP